MNEPKSDYSVTIFAAAVAAPVITAKLLGAVTWSWWVVLTSPLWVIGSVIAGIILYATTMHLVQKH